MPTPNQPEPEPQTISCPIVPDFAAAMAIFGCHIDHQDTREMLIDTGRNIDAALAVAVEEIDRLARQGIGRDMDALDPYGNDGRLQDELTQAAAKNAARSIARIQAAAKGSQS